MKCSWESCNEGAYCALEINVPAQGYPIGSHVPLSCIVNMPVCEDHYASVNLDELLFKGGPFGKGLATVFQASARGRQPPDFRRAWLSKVPLHSAKYLQFKQQVERHEAAQRTAGVKPNA